VRLLIQTRHFFCDEPTCPRKIFAERFPARLPVFARRTERATELLISIVQRTSAEAPALKLAPAWPTPRACRSVLRRCSVWCANSASGRSSHHECSGG
jgi:hypothetical protein